MAAQQTSPRSLTSIAGALLLAFGFLILFSNLDASTNGSKNCQRARKAYSEKTARWVSRSAAGPKCGSWQASRGAASCRPHGESSSHRIRGSRLQGLWTGAGEAPPETRETAHLFRRRRQSQPRPWRASPRAARRLAFGALRLLRAWGRHADSSFCCRNALVAGLRLPARWHVRGALPHHAPLTRKVRSRRSKVFLPVGAARRDARPVCGLFA